MNRTQIVRIFTHLIDPYAKSAYERGNWRRVRESAPGTNARLNVVTDDLGRVGKAVVQAAGRVYVGTYDYPTKGRPTIHIERKELA